MAHPNEEIARSATEAISKGDMEGFLSFHTDDTVVHFPGRGPMAGDHRGKDGVAKMFQQQMQLLDAPPEIENHDIVAGDDHTVVLNKTRGTRGGKMLEQNPGGRDAHRGRQDRRGLAAFFGSAGHGRVGLVLKPLAY